MAMQPVSSSSVPSQGPSGDHDYLAREARARLEIDKQLVAAGWSVQGQTLVKCDETMQWGQTRVMA
jgi:type I site-specific restriction endonuclease